MSKSAYVPSAYDTLTLAFEECETLTAHVAERLDALADGWPSPSELRALSLVSRHLLEKLHHVRLLQEASCRNA